MRRPRILVLEHHRDLREALVEALLDEGYVVTPAPSAAAGLLAVRTAGDDQLPDVAVVDAQDGGDLVRELRAQPRFSGIGVVSLRFPFDPRVESDVDVRRPFRLDDLLAGVRAALDRRQRSVEEAPQHPRS
jgi:two-component system OmpR family response regulator